MLIAQMMNGGMMDHNMMMVCMIATALFALVILILLIVQTVLQAKILGGIRELNKKTPALPAASGGAKP